MKLSIIIPAYNEEKTVLEVLQKVNRLDLLDVKKEIIVVDDGSTDQTKKIISQNKKRFKDFTFITYKKNQGKGTAVRLGIQKAKGDYILIQDADLEYNPNDIIHLISPLKKDQNIVVYGTRLKRLPNFFRDERSLRFFVHYLGNKLLSLLTSILYGQWITDMETGYKLFPKHALDGITLKSKSFDFEPEITAKLLKKGYIIKEIPIKTNPRGYDQGKKLNTVRDGLIALKTLLMYRFIQ